MKEVEIKSFTELHDALADYDARIVIYRGVKSVKYPLVPKIGRIVPPESARSKEWNEKAILRLFKEQALPYLNFTPENDWDWLALGQQHGLPTRLLDWTANPLVACYFAVEAPSEDDSVIYAYQNDSSSRSRNIQIRFAATGLGNSFPSTCPGGSPRRAVCSRSIPSLTSPSNRKIWIRSSFPRACAPR